MKKKNICFAICTYTQAEELIIEANKKNIKPIIFIKYYLVRGFGIYWIKTLQKLLTKSFNKNAFKLYVDSSNDCGLSIDLIRLKINYIKLRSNQKLLYKIKQIAKKNNVLLNPSFRIIELSNIKNISRKISTI